MATKLYAILLIPVLVALLLGGVRVRDSYDRWQEADAAERIAELVRASTAYGHALIDERDVTAGPLLAGDTGSEIVARARAATDAARDEFYARVDDAPDTDSLRRRVDAVAQAEPQLQPLRDAAYTGELPGVATEEGYVAVQHPLMSFSNELGLGSDNIAAYGRTVYAISLAKAASSLQRSIGTHLLVAPGPGERATETQLTAFGSYAYLENIARAEYVTAGTAEDGRRLTEAMAEAADDAAASAPAAPDLETMVEQISSGATPGQLADQGVTPDSWFQSATAEFDAYRAIEVRLVDDAVEEALGVAGVARRDMIVNSVVVLAAVLLALVLAGLVARAMSRDMRQLRAAAAEVAEERLPAVVAQLSRTKPGAVDTRVTPISIVGRDEIGEVARAFDQVHREAVRLAAEQALLRGNVNAIFTNLSSRNQGLIERQLALISELESREADPEQLDHLFKLDHLATRMRRNGENLLVLAGEEPENRWNQPVALVDVLRAAASEVEAYARIQISGVPEAEVRASVVNDLVHLLAELLENATTFSSPQTRVLVTATRLPDGRIMVEIHDKGIGLTQEDFAEINKRLAEPPAVDAAVSQRMGLFVVGRLSLRHGIRVQLRPSGEQSGTTSLVMLPEELTLTGGTGRRRKPARDEVAPVTGRVEVSDADRLAAARAAAELGFDESRYQGVGDPAGSTPVGRSLARGGRWPAPAAGDTPPGPAPTSSTPPAPPAAQPSGRHAAVEPYAEQPGAVPTTGPGYGEPADTQQVFGGLAPAAESQLEGPAGTSQRVGFTAPDPAEGRYPAAISAGLPRRDRQWQPEEDSAQRPREEAPASSTPAEVRWDRGPRREERTGGKTSAGLPRRVPRANLTEHPLPEPAPGGPQISRDPNDVRGRLSSLRRGVEQGRGAGKSRGAQNDERGQGPGHTYDQER
ncbi:nitrate- and nitrite sensing domain-containing protein [Streptomyces sp. NPDC127098]|uniref:nitrate- and nitrite sensing domain-containing protein n=1 Tax=Streptomyces sp. NPDC127098 TaxID=3347137 RepID=UPI00364C9D91